jgi:hypothetical protein
MIKKIEELHWKQKTRFGSKKLLKQQMSSKQYIMSIYTHSYHIHIQRLNKVCPSLNKKSLRIIKPCVPEVLSAYLTEHI